MSCRLAPQGLLSACRGAVGQQQWRACALPRAPVVLCSSGAPRDRAVALEVELEVVRARAESTAARGRRLSEKATLLRDGEARAAAEGDAATVARLRRDRAVVLNGLNAALRRLDVYRQFATKVEDYLAALAEEARARARED